MAHVHEKIDFTASIYIVFENKVLLHTHKKSGMWLAPGGHVELDEDPTQTVIREAKEETGLDVELVGDANMQYGEVNGETELIPPRFMNRHFYHGTDTHEHVDMVYFGRAHSSQFQPETGVGEMRWFTKDEIESFKDKLPPRIAMYAHTALEELAS